MMTIPEFTEEMKGQLKQYLPEELKNIECVTKVVTKNNNTVMIGIEMQIPDHNVAPVIYMEDFYQAYRDGTEMETLASQVAELYQTMKPEDKILDELASGDYQQLKDKITLRLVNAKANLPDLAVVPHRKVEDLAVIYQISLFNVREQGEASVKITNTIMNHWGVDEPTLNELAMKNTKELLPPEFCSMEEIMRELLQSDASVEEQETGMYVLTNKNKIYGAGLILYPEVLDMVSETLKKEFYILPSSVHEVIIVPKKRDMEPKELGQMVREINHTVVDRDEILSDRIYEYDKEAKAFHQVKESIERSKGLER